MPDYAKMYHKLFNTMTDCIKNLQRAQQDTEEMYLSAKEPELHIFPQQTNKAEDEEK